MRTSDALRRADEFLQDTRQHVTEALQAGEEVNSPEDGRQTSMTAKRDSRR
jgi:hypothetical protein